MTKPYRVVVDPGVFVSALITPSGPTAAVLDLLDSTSVEFVVSTRLLAELADVLGREKFRSYFTTDEADQYLYGLRDRAVVIDDPAQITPVCRDPDDDYLVALAQAADVEALISGDADLTTLDLPDLVVLTPRALLDRLAPP